LAECLWGNAGVTSGKNERLENRRSANDWAPDLNEYFLQESLRLPAALPATIPTTHQLTDTPGRHLRLATRLHTDQLESSYAIFQVAGGSLWRQ
jgi:hypothetical protein